MTAGPCLGDLVAAVVDGELDHAARERAQRHLTHCPGCRADVEANRRLKARLSGTFGADLSDGLTARLLGLAGAGDAAGPARQVRLPTGPVRPASRSATGSPEPRPAAAASPSRTGLASRTAVARTRLSSETGLRRGRRPGSRRSRRLGLGAGVAVAGLSAVLALGGPAPTRTPLDPGTDAFVTEFVGTTTGDDVDAVRTGLTGGGREPR